jgi:hypothetical protein
MLKTLMKKSSMLALLIAPILMNLQSKELRSQTIENPREVRVSANVASFESGELLSRISCTQWFPPLGGNLERECSLSFRMPGPNPGQARAGHWLSFSDQRGGRNGRTSILTGINEHDIGSIRLFSLGNDQNERMLYSNVFRDGQIQSDEIDLFEFAEFLLNFPYLRVEYVINGRVNSAVANVIQGSRTCLGPVQAGPTPAARAAALAAGERETFTCHAYHHLQGTRITNRLETLELMRAERQWAERELEEVERLLRGDAPPRTRR